jgi:hypothetical protein
MTNKETEKCKEELYQIQGTAGSREKWERLTVLAGKVYAPIPEGPHDHIVESINKITRNIHNSLQTEMMLNACTSAEQSSATAKRACTWAAVAAIASAIGAVAALMALLIK